jgi:hypothetical protein
MRCTTIAVVTPNYMKEMRWSRYVAAWRKLEICTQFYGKKEDALQI